MSSMSWSLDNAESVSLLCIEKCLLVWVFAGFYSDYPSSMRIWRRCSSTVRQMRSSQYNAFLTAGSPSAHIPATPSGHAEALPP